MPQRGRTGSRTNPRRRLLAAGQLSLRLLDGGAPQGVDRRPPKRLKPLSAAEPQSTDVPHRLLAGLLAATTSLSADPAVLVVPGMVLALLPAKLAGGRTDLKHLPQNLFIRSRAPRHQGACGGAHVGAVEIEPDALLQLLDHFLGTRQASAHAVQARAQA